MSLIWEIVDVCSWMICCSLSLDSSQASESLTQGSSSIPGFYPAGFRGTHRPHDATVFLMHVAHCVQPSAISMTVTRHGLTIPPSTHAEWSFLFLLRHVQPLQFHLPHTLLNLSWQRILLNTVSCFVWLLIQWPLSISFYLMLNNAEKFLKTIDFTSWTAAL